MNKMDQEIESVAMELFFSMGIRKITMDTIARKLKISKRTIYEHFRTKESLIRKAIDLNQDKQNAVNKRLVDESENVIEAVVKLLKGGSELLSTINPLYFTDLQRLHPRIWNEKIAASKRHSYLLIMELIKKGKQEGVYREEINEEMVSMILIEQLYMLTDRKIMPERKFPLRDIYEMIIITMTRGIATDKGLKLLVKYQEQP